MPGHSLGLDVHDSRQYLKAKYIDLPASTRSTPSALYTYLRIRQPLQENMVLTVEPGCYFAPQLMAEHGVWESKFVDVEKLKLYIGVGGVRIEDAVVVRSGQCENLTIVGRERDWVESACSGSASTAAPDQTLASTSTTAAQPATSSDESETELPTPDHISVLYASETGNAQDVAERVGREVRRRGGKAVVESMEEFDIVREQ
jgi:hypothetical protein